MKRVASALILVPLVVYVVLWGHPLLFLAVVGAVALLSQYEYAGIVKQHGIRSPGPLAYGAGLLLLFLPGHELAVLMVTALLALTLGLASTDLKSGLPRAAALLFGVIYIFGCWKFAVLLREIDRQWLLFALALSWVGDTAAYYVGRAFGRHKMAPVVSPAKTWEGAVASVVAAVLFGVLYAAKFVPWSPLPVAAVLALAGNVAGQIGDLAESAIKRGAGVKDSSGMLPGHGGWLDRVDSSLFAVPVIYGLVRLFARA